jgi:hypothetical protein
VAVETTNICCPDCQALIGPVKEMPTVPMGSLGEKLAQCPRCGSQFAVWHSFKEGLRMRKLSNHPGAQLQAVGPPFLVTLILPSGSTVVTRQLPDEVKVLPTVIIHGCEAYLNSRVLNGTEPLLYVKASCYDLDDGAHYDGLGPTLHLDPGRPGPVSDSELTQALRQGSWVIDDLNVRNEVLSHSGEVPDDEAAPRGRRPWDSAPLLW